MGLGCFFFLFLFWRPFGVGHNFMGKLVREGFQFLGALHYKFLGALHYNFLRCAQMGFVLMTSAWQEDLHSIVT